MTGPAHYRRAEVLLARADEVGPEQAEHLHRAAQVHATLALTAAAAQDRLGIKDREAWITALTDA